MLGAHHPRKDEVVVISKNLQIAVRKQNPFRELKTMPSQALSRGRDLIQDLVLKFSQLLYPAAFSDNIPSTVFLHARQRVQFPQHSQLAVIQAGFRVGSRLGSGLKFG